MTIIDLESRGIPIGRSPEVSLRNNHAQYIVTWYVALAPPFAGNRYSDKTQVFLVLGHIRHVLHVGQETSTRHGPSTAPAQKILDPSQAISVSCSPSPSGFRSRRRFLDG